MVEVRSQGDKDKETGLVGESGRSSCACVLPSRDSMHTHAACGESRRPAVPSGAQRPLSLYARVTPFFLFLQPVQIRTYVNMHAVVRCNIIHLRSELKTLLILYICIYIHIEF